MTRKSVKIFSGIAILAFAVLIFFDIEWTNAISYAVTIAALLEYAYDRWLWKVISKKKIPVLTTGQTIAHRITASIGDFFVNAL